MTDRWIRRTWERAAADNAYFVVCNEDAYRSGTMDVGTRTAFFQSGENHVAWVFGVIERLLGTTFAPRRALDFGCGVGRLLLPIAERSRSAVGCDVSAAMLEEARRNAAVHGVDNLTLVQAPGELVEVPGRFDFVHSFITFQHIPPATGERVVARLLDALEPDGIAALQFTYHRSVPRWRRWVHAVRRTAPPLNAVAGLVRGRGAGEPFFPMYEYRLERLYEIFRAAGCSAIVGALTRHGTHHGVLLVARRDS